MLTNNYLLIQTYYASNGYVNDAQNTDISGTKDLEGTNRPFYIGTAWSQTINYNASPRKKLSIALGTGTTAISNTDYCLDNDISDDLDLTCVINTGSEGGAIKTVLTVSGTNTTENEVTIKEFGILKEYMVGPGTLTYVNYLIAREFLKTPKVVGAGQPFTLTFEWSGS